MRYVFADNTQKVSKPFEIEMYRFFLLDLSIFSRLAFIYVIYLKIWDDESSERLLISNGSEIFVSTLKTVKMSQMNVRKCMLFNCRYNFRHSAFF